MKADIPTILCLNCSLKEISKYMAWVCMYKQDICFEIQYFHKVYSRWSGHMERMDENHIMVKSINWLRRGGKREGHDLDGLME